MATDYVKISQLLPIDAATLTNDEPIPTVQAGATKAVTGNNILTEAGFRGSGTSVVSFQALIRTLLQGLIVSRASTTTFTVAAGTVGDSTFVHGMTLTSSMTKSLSAWAAGTAAGGLDTGAVASNTWYAVYLIKNPTTETVDVLISTNGTTPTALPSGYTLYRRVAWIKTNGSSQITSFTQTGRTFLWADPVQELADATPAATTRQTVTLASAAPDTRAKVVNHARVSAGQFVVFGPLTQTDTAASATNYTHRTGTDSTIAALSQEIPLNSSRQMFYRTSATSTLITIRCEGWIDELSA